MGWLSNLFLDIASGDYLFVVSFLLLLAYLGWRAYCKLRLLEEQRPYKRFFGLSLQIGVTLFLERLYEFTRAHVAVSQLTALAYSNGYKVANFEISHGFFFEPALEHFFTPDVWLMHAIYAIYAFAHLFATLGLLIWVYVKRNSAFAFVRNMFYVSTAMALVVYMTFPTTPPRFFSDLGLYDPEQVLGFTPAGGAQLSAQTFNPYAAMPSLHMIYALIVGGTLLVLGRHVLLRAAGLLYPFIMLAVVLISANHWILDAVGALVVVAGSAAVLAGAGRLATATKSLLPARGYSLFSSGASGPA